MLCAAYSRVLEMFIKVCGKTKCWYLTSEKALDFSRWRSVRVRSNYTKFGLILLSNLLFLALVVVFFVAFQNFTCWCVFPALDDTQCNQPWLFIISVLCFILLLGGRTLKYSASDFLLLCMTILSNRFSVFDSLIVVVKGCSAWFMLGIAQFLWGSYNQRIICVTYIWYSVLDTCKQNRVLCCFLFVFSCLWR